MALGQRPEHLGDERSAGKLQRFRLAGERGKEEPRLTRAGEMTRTSEQLVRRRDGRGGGQTWAKDGVDNGVPGRRVGTPGGPGKRQVGLRAHQLGNRPDELIWGER